MANGGILWPMPISMLASGLIWSAEVLYTLSQLHWVEMCSCPVTRRYCFLVVSLWLWHPFQPLFCSDPWALEGGSAEYMFHLGLSFCSLFIFCQLSTPSLKRMDHHLKFYMEWASGKHTKEFPVNFSIKRELEPQGRELNPCLTPDATTSEQNFPGGNKQLPSKSKMNEWCASPRKSGVLPSSNFTFPIAALLMWSHTQGEPVFSGSPLFSLLQPEL